MLKDDFLWVEKYRPKVVADTILPENLKETFQTYVDKKQIPNLILEGPQGLGKTTIARAILEQINADYIIINGSLDRNIDTLRNEISNFASSVSLTGDRKYVIIDEADYLNANSTQPALRNFVEKYSKNCGFIMTCNFVNRIIEPIHSRFSVVSFKLNKKDLPGLAAQFLKRCCTILDTEGVEYEKAVVAEVVKKYLPDWRRVLNELQRYSAIGKIDSGILSSLDSVTHKQLVGYLKEKDFTNMRKWVGENFNNDSTELFKSLYTNASEYMEKASIPMLVVILARYQYQNAFVADHELNLVACLTEIMMECDIL